MRNALLTSGLVAATLLLASSLATAGTATDNLLVTANVTANCTIDATAGLAFGEYDPIDVNKAVDLAKPGSISTTCTSGATATVTLGEGAHADDGSTPAAPARRMIGAENKYLSYGLYTDEAHGTVWDNVTGVEVTGDGTASTTTVYGLVPAGQNVPAHAYTDTVVATVTF